MIRVLFVCLGNICRSPMAEAVFMHRVRLAGLEGEIVADSVGTSDWNVGRPPHRGTMRILRSRGIDYSHSARQIALADFGRFDYIITMDESNYADVAVLHGSASRTETHSSTVARLMDYAPHLGHREVPDPYYTDRFEEVHGLIDAACQGLLTTICQEQGLTLRSEESSAASESGKGETVR